MGTAQLQPISISPSLSSGRNRSSLDYPGFGARLQRSRTSLYTTHVAQAFTSQPERAPEVLQGAQGLLEEVSMELDSECSDDVDAGGLEA